ncbi:hypothetical protein [Streptomyces sp. NBC_01217]|uniref:hypothetical protein n=1 Tax=Streptomyces sp. NBC_01217 TaxID=2903779 RepID=UPI002E12E14B|nr:hypothetical protein OG507_34335 [Streptomyces sp. NBC_01217]
MNERTGTARQCRTTSVDPENLDINKPLNFHYEETTIHWSEALCMPDGAHRRIPEPWHAVPFQATRRP